LAKVKFEKRENPKGGGKGTLLKKSTPPVEQEGSEEDHLERHGKKGTSFTTHVLFQKLRMGDGDQGKPCKKEGREEDDRSRAQSGETGDREWRLKWGGSPKGGILRMGGEMRLEKSITL